MSRIAGGHDAKSTAHPSRSLVNCRRFDQANVFGGIEYPDTTTNGVMQRPTSFHESISLDGLQLAPAQVFGAIRLVPVLRPEAPGDLRLYHWPFEEEQAVVRLNDKTEYHAYIPHGLVATWSRDGRPAASFGTHMRGAQQRRWKGEYVSDWDLATTRVLDRIRVRVGKQALRFLPLHVSMEGFLALHFRGPDIAWEEYSRTAIRDGLSPRLEDSIPGKYISGLDDALRQFEIHQDQVGVLLFVGEQLASSFVCSHPDDYRKLQHTLLTDFYGELVYYHGFSLQENEIHPEPINAENVQSLDDLESELAKLRSGYENLHRLMSNRLFERSLATEQIYRMGRFVLKRFMTQLDPKSENHIGEMILRDDGTLEYLKTYQLSGAQCRRAYLLMHLAENAWELDGCAEALGCDRNHLILRLESSGFGYLLHQHVLDAARAAKRRS